MYLICISSFEVQCPSPSPPSAWVRRGRHEVPAAVVVGLSLLLQGVGCSGHEFWKKGLEGCVDSNVPGARAVLIWMGTCSFCLA